jgi:sugar lactone lactonase YvrE
MGSRCPSVGRLLLVCLALAPMMALVPTAHGAASSDLVARGGSISSPKRAPLVSLLSASTSTGSSSTEGAILVRVAGTGASGLASNDSPATQTNLFEPSAVAAGPEGSFFIANYATCQVLEVTNAGVLTVVVGNGTCGSAGFGGPGVDASISNPAGLAYDPTTRDLYIADTDACEVLVLSSSGILFVVAGNGTCGYSGDGGQATQAELDQPHGLAIGPSGSLYIADTDNCVIRKVDSSGVITTVAGNGTCGYSGDGGQATQAELDGPEAVAVSSEGNLYIADTSNCVIRKVDSSGVITTVAGNGTCGYSGDGGQATQAELSYPFGISIGPSGSLYIADTDNCVIRKVDSSGVITTVAGNGTCGYSGDGGQATQAELSYPEGVANVSSGGVLIADTGNNVVQEFSSQPLAPVVSSVAPDSGPPQGGQTVTIHGYGFTGATQVAFGGVAGENLDVISDFELQVTVPQATQGNGIVNVTVTTPVATSVASADDAYLYVAPGWYHPISPVRICDTRPDNPSNLSGAYAQCNGVNGSGETLVPDSTLTIKVAGLAGIPTSGASAVVLNVTVTDTTAPGYLTVYPTGLARPVASNLNFTSGETVPNLVTVALGASGEVSLYNSSGFTDVVVDAEGWFGQAAGDGYHPISPVRICDTRPDNPSNLSGAYAQCNGVNGSGETLVPDSTLTIKVAGLAGIPTSGASAVVLNVTVTDTTAPGYLTVYPTGLARPVASNLNFTSGETTPNRVIVGLGAAGEVSIYNSSGFTDVVVDVGGWFGGANGLVFQPLSPTRVADTRSGSGEPYAGQTLQAGDTLEMQVAGLDGIPTGAEAVSINVTVTDTSSDGFLTIYPAGTARPMASDLNWSPGETRANMDIADLGQSQSVDVYNSSGSTDVIIDVDGWYEDSSL